MTTTTPGAAELDDYLQALAAAPRQSHRDQPRTGLAALLERAGNPQDTVRAVRVTGSKGKGSTALVMESILGTAGHRVGVFCSPHIEHWCERIRLDGQPITADCFAKVLAELAPDIDALRAKASICGPDLFEVCLVVALVVFARADIDLAMIESGIGAATDATHVVPSVLSVITTVEAEHLDQIGPRLVDIAREKAGVMTPGAPLVMGRLPGPARREICHRADALECPTLELGVDFEATRARQADEYVLHYRHGFYRLTLPVSTGLYWLNDVVALAIAAVKRLPGFDVDVASLGAAIGNLELPGRLERVASRPTLIADCAHTLASSRLLAAALAARDEWPRVLVLSCSIGHDPMAIAPELWHHIDRIVVTQAETTRSRPAIDTATAIEQRGRSVARIESRPLSALAHGVQLAGADGLVCAAGSVYMAGQARGYARRIMRYPLSTQRAGSALRLAADRKNRGSTC